MQESLCWPLSWAHTMSEGVHMLVFMEACMCQEFEHVCVCVCSENVSLCKFTSTRMCLVWCVEACEHVILREGVNIYADETWHCLW